MKNKAELTHDNKGGEDDTNESKPIVSQENADNYTFEVAWQSKNFNLMGVDDLKKAYQKNADLCNKLVAKRSLLK